MFKILVMASIIWNSSGNMPVGVKTEFVPYQGRYVMSAEACEKQAYEGRKAYPHRIFSCKSADTIVLEVVRAGE